MIAEHPDVAKDMLAAYDKWFDGALPNMVNEDAPLKGHNTFKLMFWKQYGMDIPPEPKPRAPRQKKEAAQSKKRLVKKQEHLLRNSASQFALDRLNFSSRAADFWSLHDRSAD